MSIPTGKGPLTVTLRRLVDAKSWDFDNWGEVIVLMAGRLTDPSPMLRLLADVKTDAWGRPRLCLAAQCGAELTTERREALERTGGRDSPSPSKVARLVFELLVEQMTWEQLPVRNVRVSSFLEAALPPLGDLAGIGLSTRLREVLRGSPSREGILAKYALRKLRESASRQPRIIDELIDSLRNTDKLVRQNAAGFLAAIRKSAALEPRVLDALIHRLSDPEADVRLSALEALTSMMGTAGRQPEVLDGFIRCLGDADGYVHGYAEAL